MKEHGLWDLGSPAYSVCVWAWELTSLTELLPVEKGITVLTLQGCYEDYVNVGGSVPNMVLGTETSYKGECNTISLCHGGGWSPESAPATTPLSSLQPEEDLIHPFPLAPLLL